jgi:hypothetical protein
MAPDLQTSPQRGGLLPPVPWRDPYTVAPQKLMDYIRALELACVENQDSADLRTCLGMAYAMNYDVYKSMDAFEAACHINPNSFWARFKYAELHYRLRALTKSEEETLRAFDLATNSLEVSLSRKQLLEIRRLMRMGTVKPVLIRSLAVPALVLAVMSVAVCLMTVLK